MCRADRRKPRQPDRGHSCQGDLSYFTALINTAHLLLLQNILLVGVRRRDLSCRVLPNLTRRSSQGFGESPYLHRTLADRYEKRGIRIISADEPSKKAVSEGAALFYIKDSVIARATRFDFGIQTTK